MDLSLLANFRLNYKAKRLLRIAAVVAVVYFSIPFVCGLIFKAQYLSIIDELNAVDGLRVKQVLYDRGVERSFAITQVELDSKHSLYGGVSKLNLGELPFDGDLIFTIFHEIKHGIWLPQEGRELKDGLALAKMWSHIRYGKADNYSAEEEEVKLLDIKFENLFLEDPKNDELILTDEGIVGDLYIKVDLLGKTSCFLTSNEFKVALDEKRSASWKNLFVELFLPYKLTEFRGKVFLPEFDLFANGQAELALRGLQINFASDKLGNTWVYNNHLNAKSLQFKDNVSARQMELEDVRSYLISKPKDKLVNLDVGFSVGVVSTDKDGMLGPSHLYINLDNLEPRALGYMQSLISDVEKGLFSLEELSIYDSFLEAAPLFLHKKPSIALDAKLSLPGGDLVLLTDFSLGDKKVFDVTKDRDLILRSVRGELFATAPKEPFYNTVSYLISRNLLAYAKSNDFTYDSIDKFKMEVTDSTLNFIAKLMAKQYIVVKDDFYFAEIEAVAGEFNFNGTNYNLLLVE